MRSRGAYRAGLASLATLAALGAGAVAVAQSGSDRVERTLRADLDRDGTAELVTVRRTRPGDDVSPLRVAIADPDNGRSARVGPVVDQVGRVTARDFARIGRPQVFAEGSSGVSGGFYSATLTRWTGTRQRVLFRYESGRAARGPAGTLVRSANVTGLGRSIRLRELLVPPEGPSCCPSSVRVRSSVFRYSPREGRYLLARRVTGPPRDPRTP